MAGVLYIGETYMIYPSFVPPARERASGPSFLGVPYPALISHSQTLPHHRTIIFPTTTSNSQPRMAAHCIKVKAYLMKQQRELWVEIAPHPRVISKVTANEKQTDKVARIPGDVETAKARNG
ncbi:hypothetical protein BS47DRAFT_778789 [Hydnum rufescens UP504]|uniref:Uncharacterized protein n=1 Tax=Hydnum rufescens UP504 TaxID=1448309 RepID=A0A9P6ADD7_9AGAM|nr:hypothetical protein BS47DRAFT_778789 [Hydnum rufescens UP504]